MLTIQIYIQNSMEQNKNSQQESSESTENKKSEHVVKPPISFFYETDWFPITTSPWITALSFVFYVFFIIHCIDFYSDHFLILFPTSQNARIITQFITKDLIWISFVLNTLLTIFSFLSLFFSQPTGEGVQYVLGWIGNKLFPINRYMIELNVAVAALFIIKDPQAIIIFVLTVFTNIFITFIGQNYTQRKDYLCCKSLEFLMVFKSIIILGYSLNCIAYFTVKSPENQTQLIIYCFLHLVLALGLFISFFTFGFIIYRYFITQFLLIEIINLYLGLSMGNFYDLIATVATSRVQTNRNLIIGGVFFVILNLLSFSIWSSLKRKSTLIDQPSLKKKIFFLYNKLQNSPESIDDDCEIRGIIKYHLTQNCQNLFCFKNSGSQQYYDSKKNKFCSTDKINQGKGSFVKFIIKCLYEEQLQKSKWNDTDLLLDYVEFYYTKLKNVFKATIFITEIEKRFLTPFYKLRLTRIRRIMKQQNQSINRQLYNGSLDFENLVFAEQKFDQIQTSLRDILNRNITFWQYIQKEEINLSSITKIIKPNLRLIEEVNNDWKDIAKYFETQRIWKFYFIWYTLYIKNQKLKPHFLEEFGHSVQWSDIFMIESQHIDRTSENSKLFVPKLIFEKQVCCIHIDRNEQRPIIKSVSRYFQKNFKYKSSEILESSIDMLMTPTLKKIHQKMLTAWAGEGKTNNEINYMIKKVFPVDKNQYIVPVFKFYKQFQSIEQELRYIALLKKNQISQYTLILSEKYEIEGMTEALATKINISHAEYESILGVNWLLFMPTLIDQNKIRSQYEDQLENTFIQNKSNHFSSSRRFKKSVNPKKQKQINKSNVTLMIPHNIEKLAQFYKQRMRKFEHDSQNISKILQQGNNTLGNANYQKFTTQVQLKEITFNDNFSHLELYIREIQGVGDPKLAGQANINKLQEFEATSLKNKHDQIDQVPMEDDFNNFFETSQQNDTVSLAFSDNIFIKEENNQPVEMIGYVGSVTLFIRIILILIFLLTLAIVLVERQHYIQQRDLGQQMHQKVKFEVEAFEINQKMSSYILNITNYKKSIENMTDDMKSTRNDLSFRKAILNRKVNSKYYYKFSDTTREYDHIDLIDTLIKNMIEIKHTGNSIITADSTTYNEFVDLIVPGLEDMVYTSINNIRQLFVEIYEKLLIRNYAVYAACGLILIIGFIAILLQLIKISKSLTCIIEIFTELGESDIKRVKKYCKQTMLTFQFLNLRYDRLKDADDENLTFNQLQQKKSREQSESQNYSNDNKSSNEHFSKLQSGFKETDEVKNSINLNKKVKVVQVGRIISSYKRKSIFLAIAVLAIHIFFVLGINVYTYFINKEIMHFENSGKNLFEQYAVLNILFLKYKERAIKEKAFNPERYSIYEDRIENMKKLKKVEVRLGGEKYYTAYNDILFESFCGLYPEFLEARGYTSQQCLQVSESTLDYGVQSYLFYLSSKIDQSMLSQEYQMDPKLAKNLQSAMQISNSAFLYLGEVWSEQFSNFINNLEIICFIILGGFLLLQIVLYIVFVKVLLMGHLKDNFVFFRKVYEFMMPDFIVTKQKIIKAKLEVEGIIKK